MRLPRILVVDDDPGMLRAVERVLSQDYEVAGTRLPRSRAAASTPMACDSLATTTAVGGRGNASSLWSAAAPEAAPTSASSS